jgi:hypothetical protein
MRQGRKLRVWKGKGDMYYMSRGTDGNGSSKKKVDFKKKGIGQYLGRKFKRCEIMEYLSMTKTRSEMQRSKITCR